MANPAISRKSCSRERPSGGDSWGAFGHLLAEVREAPLVTRENARLAEEQPAQFTSRHVVAAVASFGVEGEGTVFL